VSSPYSQPTQPLTVRPLGRDVWPYGAIAVVVGGVGAITGALLSWVTVAAEAARARREVRITLNGVDLPDGKVVVAAAIVAVIAAAIAWFVRNRETGIVLGVVAALAGLVILAVGVVDAISPSRSVGAVANQVAGSSRISAHRAEAALRTLAARGGVSISPQEGLFLALLGGLVIVVGGIALAVRAGASGRPARRY
jgi:hypothetical protein